MTEKRLIDADALFGKMEETPWYNNKDRDEIAEELVFNAPTVDAVPVVHGRWELDKYGGVACTKCGKCVSIGGETALHNAKSSQKYCPNCGAKMDLEVQE